jgi:peptide/nickel transport system substrate-binding protein
VAVIAAALVLTLTACGGDSDSDPDSDAGAAVADGGDLVVGVGALPPTLSPFITQPTPPRSFSVNPMYSFLTKLDTFADGAPVVPSIATEWTQDSDTSWTFTLQPDLTFPNGEPLDAAAVKFAIDYVLDPANEAGITSAIGPISSATVVDATTVTIGLDAPEFDLPRYLTILPLVPPVDFAARGADAFFTDPIATGMWKVASYTPNEELVLEANPDSLSGDPKLDSVTFKVIVENAARVSALQTGAVDVITKVPTDQVPALESADLQVLSINEARMYLGDLYKADGPLNDVRVRQALNYAVDTESLVDNVMGGFGLDEQGQLSPSTVSGSCQTSTPYDYDLEKANELMSEAGVSDLDLTIGSSQGFLINDSLLAQAISAQLEKLDAVSSVKVETMEFSNYLDVFYGKTEAQDIFMWGMSSAPGLDMTRNLGRFTTDHSDRNPDGYQNDEYDALYDELIATSPDDPARAELSCQLSAIVKDDALVLFGLYTPDIWAMGSDVKDFNVDPNGNPDWLSVGLAG